MSKKSKWFVVATEGATTDGRNIERSWIEEMADSYDPVNTYGARINLDHIKLSFYWEDMPNAHSFGDVLAVKAEEREDGKLQLLAEIKPTDGLLELNQKGQKVYTSVEIDTKFADTGKAYLVGLAVTDNPASLGTEMLQFTANGLANRKLKPENLFSAAIETALEFEEVEEKQSFKLLEKIKDLFANKTKSDNDNFAEHQQAIEIIGEETAKTVDKLTELLAENTALSQKVESLEQSVSAMTAKFAQLEKLPSKDYTPRPIIAGEGLENNLTDC